MSAAAQPTGCVYLVGAGPGDPGLITVRGCELLTRADTVVHDRLSAGALLQHARPDAEIVNVGKAPGHQPYSQEQINHLLIERARAGRCVVRLKGGDPFVFGRGGEELAACHAAGIPCVVVPGVSSAIAVPAAAGVPITQRGVSRSFTVLTAQNLEQSGPAALPDATLAGADTLVVLMGRANLAELMARIRSAGRPPETPVICIQEGTTPRQRCAAGTLATMAAVAEAAGIESPMVIVVGEVAAWRREPPGGAARVSDSCALEGLRVINTRPVQSSRELVDELTRRGAQVIDCPLIEIAPPSDHGELDRIIEQLAAFDWIVFTSQHGVGGLWNRLEHCGFDSRALALCRIAAVGPRTAEALARRGVKPDLVPAVHSAAGLLQAFAAAAPALHIKAPKLDGRSGPLRVLLLRSDRARPELPEGLRRMGLQTVEVACYRTLPLEITEQQRRQLSAGADVVLLYSPSAVEAWQSAARLIVPPAPVLACIGPTTAQAVRATGAKAAIIAPQPSDASLVQAVQDYFAINECSR